MSHNDDKSSTPDKKALLQKEGRFWDLQEERIDQLYARPHDWRFVPALAEKIIQPRVDTFLRLLDAHKDEIHTLVDIGCGNGWLCHATAKRGIRSIGIDLSAKKIETARRMAEEQGVADRCEFWAGDVMDWRPDQPVDLLTSHGSLHHFPDFHKSLQHMVAEFLRPDGYLLFVEPNHEGMAPEVREFLLEQAKNSPLTPHFDFEFYFEVTGQESLEGPPKAAADDMDIRDESPAGKEFFGEHIHLDDYFEQHFEVVEKEFYHYFASHATNAFYVFMKSPFVREAWVKLLPHVVARDTRLLRDPQYQRWAEDALWFMRPKGVQR